jgi:hypothetical protein
MPEKEPQTSQLPRSRRMKRGSTKRSGVNKQGNSSNVVHHVMSSIHRRLKDKRIEAQRRVQAVLAAGGN